MVQFYSPRESGLKCQSSWASHCNNVYTKTSSCSLTLPSRIKLVCLTHNFIYVCDHAAHDIKDTGPLYFRHNLFYSDLGYSLDNLGSKSQHEQEIFPFSKMSRLVPGPRLRMSDAILLIFLYAFMGCKETTDLDNCSIYCTKLG